MAETGCGDPPADSNSSDLIINQELAKVKDSREDLVTKVAKLESQIEDVTSTLVDEKEIRRLVQHELESSNSLCQKLEQALQSQKNAPSRDRVLSQHEQGIQTERETGIQTDREYRTGSELVPANKKDVSREKPRQQMRNYSAASMLVEEYKVNQESLEFQVTKLSQECSAKDDDLSRVGQKCAEFIQTNAQLETEIESVRDELGKQQRVIDRQEIHLKEKDSSLEEKSEMMKKLKEQRDVLSGKYYRAKRQASKLKEVVISFNKTVSEFRKEREHLVNKTVNTRGMAGTNIMDDSHNSYQDQNHIDTVEAESTGSATDEGPSTPSSTPRGNDRPDQISPGDKQQSCQEPEGWYRGPDHQVAWFSDGSDDSCTEISCSTPHDQGPHDQRPHDQGPHDQGSHDRPHREQTSRPEGRVRKQHTQHKDWGTHSSRREHSEVFDLRGRGHQSDKRHHGSQRGSAWLVAPFGDESSDKEDSFCTASDVSNSFYHGDDSEDETDYYHKVEKQAGRRGGQRSNMKGAARRILLEGASSTDSLRSKHDTAEGLFLVKHEMESYAAKAVDRSWHFVYIVHEGSKVWFHENRDFASLGLTLDGLDPLDLSGAIVCPLRDYAKRSHVFCIQLTSGARYLFQAQDEMDMLYWICRLSSGTGDVDTTQDCFTQVKAPIRGSPTKTDRLKNFVRGGLSAIWK